MASRKKKSPTASTSGNSTLDESPLVPLRQVVPSCDADLEGVHFEGSAVLDPHSSTELHTRLSYPSEEPSLLEELRSALSQGTSVKKLLQSKKFPRNMTLDFSLSSSSGSLNSTADATLPVKKYLPKTLTRKKRNNMTLNFTMNDTAASSDNQENESPVLPTDRPKVLFKKPMSKKMSIRFDNLSELESSNVSVHDDSLTIKNVEKVIVPSALHARKTTNKDITIDLDLDNSDSCHLLPDRDKPTGSVSSTEEGHDELIPKTLLPLRPRPRVSRDKNMTFDVSFNSTKDSEKSVGANSSNNAEGLKVASEIDVDAAESVPVIKEVTSSPVLANTFIIQPAPLGDLTFEVEATGVKADIGDLALDSARNTSNKVDNNNFVVSGVAACSQVPEAVAHKVAHNSMVEGIDGDSTNVSHNCEKSHLEGEKEKTIYERRSSTQAYKQTQMLHQTQRDIENNFNVSATSTARSCHIDEDNDSLPLITTAAENPLKSRLRHRISVPYVGNDTNIDDESSIKSSTDGNGQIMGVLPFEPITYNNTATVGTSAASSTKEEAHVDSPTFQNLNNYKNPLKKARLNRNNVSVACKFDESIDNCEMTNTNGTGQSPRIQIVVDDAVALRLSEPLSSFVEQDLSSKHTNSLADRNEEIDDGIAIGGATFMNEHSNNGVSEIAEPGDVGQSSNNTSSIRTSVVELQYSPEPVDTCSASQSSDAVSLGCSLDGAESSNSERNSVSIMRSENVSMKPFEASNSSAGMGPASGDNPSMLLPHGKESLEDLRLEVSLTGGLQYSSETICPEKDASLEKESEQSLLLQYSHEGTSRTTLLNQNSLDCPKTIPFSLRRSTRGSKNITAGEVEPICDNGAQPICDDEAQLGSITTRSSPRDNSVSVDPSSGPMQCLKNSTLNSTCVPAEELHNLKLAESVDVCQGPQNSETVNFDCGLNKPESANDHKPVSLMSEKISVAPDENTNTVIGMDVPIDGPNVLFPDCKEPPNDKSGRLQNPDERLCPKKDGFIEKELQRKSQVQHTPQVVIKKISLGQKSMDISSKSPNPLRRSKRGSKNITIGADLLTSTSSVSDLTKLSMESHKNPLKRKSKINKISIALTDSITEPIVSDAEKSSNGNDPKDGVSSSNSLDPKACRSLHITSPSPPVMKTPIEPNGMATSSTEPLTVLHGIPPQLSTVPEENPVCTDKDRVDSCKEAVTSVGEMEIELLEPMEFMTVNSHLQQVKAPLVALPDVEKNPQHVDIAHVVHNTDATSVQDKHCPRSVDNVNPCQTAPPAEPSGNAASADFPGSRKSKRKSVSFKPSSEYQYHSPPEHSTVQSENQSALGYEFSKIQMTTDLSDIQSSPNIKNAKRHFSSTPNLRSKRQVSPAQSGDLFKPPLPPVPNDHQFTAPATKRVSIQLVPQTIITPSGKEPTVNIQGSLEGGVSYDLSGETSLEISEIPKDANYNRGHGLYTSTPLHRGKGSMKRTRKKTEQLPEFQLQAEHEQATVASHSVQTEVDLKSNSRIPVASDDTLNPPSTSDISSGTLRRSKRRKTSPIIEQTDSDNQRGSNSGNQKPNCDSPAERISIQDNTIVSTRVGSQSRTRGSRTRSSINATFKSYDSHRKMTSRRLFDDIRDDGQIHSDLPAVEAILSPKSIDVPMMAEAASVSQDDLLSNSVTSIVQPSGVSYPPSDTSISVQQPNDSDNESVTSSVSTGSTSSIPSHIVTRQSFESQLSLLQDQSKRESRAHVDNFALTNPLPRSKFAIARPIGSDLNYLYPKDALLKKRGRSQSVKVTLFNPGPGWKKSQQLYAWLKKKLEPDYKLRTNLESELLVVDLNHARNLVACGHIENALDVVIERLRRLNICTNQVELWGFMMKFMPFDFLQQILPISRNNLALPFDPI